MSTRYKYACGCCDWQFVTMKETIAHYRKEHPDSGYSCWDCIGDLGDPLANSALEGMRERLLAQATRLDEARAKAKAYDELRPRFDKIARALQVVRLTSNEDF